MQELTIRVEAEAKAVGLNMNAEKTKVMKIGQMDPGQSLQTERKVIAEVPEFCYLGRTLAQDGTCDKEITIRFGKAN